MLAWLSSCSQEALCHPEHYGTPESFLSAVPVWLQMALVEEKRTWECSGSPLASITAAPTTCEHPASLTVLTQIKKWHYRD